MKRVVAVATFSFLTVSANAGPIISATCMKSPDGRTLVSMSDDIIKQADALGYYDKTCMFSYQIRKFTKTSFDGWTNGVCMLELRRWTSNERKVMKC